MTETSEPEWVAKTFPIRLRFDLKLFNDSLSKDEVLQILKFGDGVTAEVGEPEYEAA